MGGNERLSLKFILASGHIELGSIDLLWDAGSLVILE